MDHLTSNNWVSLGGEPITNIRHRIQKRFDDDRFTFHVGTDSKQYKEYTNITTTICFREDTKGALVAYQRNKIENFNNYRGWVCSGIWESLDSTEAKGGPFQSFLFYDYSTDRTFHINTLVHNPGKNKALYIRQMKLVAKSFKSYQSE